MIAPHATTLEALCLGETMVQVTPQPGGHLDRASEFVLRPAGAESNVAAHLAALGHRAGWASRVGADPLGELLTEEMAEAGVDLEFIARDPQLPTGVMFKNPHPVGTSVYYYRAGSAASAMDPSFAAVIAAAAPEVLHLSGITPALSSGCRDLVEHLILDRPCPGTTVSFDVNHRPKLWDRDAGPELLRLAKAADVVFVGLDEAERLWGTATAEDVRKLIGDPVRVVVKDGANEAVCFDADGVWREPAPEVEVVEPVGAGDAFAAGWLSGMLRGFNHAVRLRLGHLAAGAVLGTMSDQADLPPVAEICTRIGIPRYRWAAGPRRTEEA